MNIEQMAKDELLSLRAEASRALRGEGMHQILEEDAANIINLIDERLEALEPKHTKLGSIVIPERVMKVMTAKALYLYGGELLEAQRVDHVDRVDTYDEIEEAYQMARTIYNSMADEMSEVW